MIPQAMLADPVAATVRIRSGQRSRVFATAGRVGLRDEQLHDLIEGVSGYRTREISRLTIGEARHLIGVLMRMRRVAAAGARG